MKSIVFIIGTRPELIKIHEVVNQLNKEKKIRTIVISSNQQSKLLPKYLVDFKFDFTLEIRKFKNDAEFFSKFFSSIGQLLTKINFDYIMVQGDTSTAYAGALYGFLNKIPVIHLEAGLRTNDLKSPWPEEFYRQNISKMSKFHLSQTINSKINLSKEGIKNNVYVVGNPGIDYFMEHVSIHKKNKLNTSERKKILITMHRRESLENNLEKFILNLKRCSLKNKNIEFFWPVHPNPKVKKIIKSHSHEFKKLNINLLKPLDFKSFITFLDNVDYVITDSGGVQEEAAYLGKPVLIARDKTERIEIIELELGKIIFGDGRYLDKFINYFSKRRIKTENINKWRKIQGSGSSAMKISKLLSSILFK